MDCRIGKTLNPKTCVYVKDCKPGFSRNARFVCRKKPDINKAKSKAKSKMNINYKKSVLNRTKKLMEKRIMEKRIMEKRMENQLEQDKRVANERQAKLNALKTNLKTKMRLKPVSKKNPTPRIKVRA